jgi:hypothetical protein
MMLEWLGPCRGSERGPTRYSHANLGLTISGAVVLHGVLERAKQILGVRFVCDLRAT